MRPYDADLRDWLVKVMDDLHGLELRIQRWEQENSEPDAGSKIVAQIAVML
jgi:hypothetical protein